MCSGCPVAATSGLTFTNDATTPLASHSKLNDSLHFRQRASPAELGFTRTHKELHRYSFPSVLDKRSNGHLTGNKLFFLSSESIRNLFRIFIIFNDRIVLRYPIDDSAVWHYGEYSLISTFFIAETIYAVDHGRPTELVTNDVVIVMDWLCAIRHLH